MAIGSAFNKFPAEAALIGRILADYAILELDLMNCVKAVNDDLDTVLRAMYRFRGETRRIDNAVELGRQPYDDLGFVTQFDMAIEAIRYCLDIRNQYAHWIWWRYTDEQLVFANLEDVAKQDELITDLNDLEPHHMDVSLLERQINYYEYTDSLIFSVIHEGNRKAGRPNIPSIRFPAPLERPPLFL